MEFATLSNDVLVTEVTQSVAIQDWEEVAGKCARSDTDANYGVYTYHLLGILGLAALCIIGNSIVIFIMTKECSMSSPLNCFIVSLACSDLLQGLVYSVYNISHLPVPIIRETLGQWAVCCPLLMTVLLSLMSSPYNLVGITVVRYMSVRWPLHHTTMLTKKKTFAGIFAAWMTAVTFAFAFYIRLRPDPWCEICRSELHWHMYQLAAMLVLAAATPFTIMTALFISMTRIYTKHVKGMSQAGTNANMDPKGKKAQQKEQTLSRISAFLVTYFFISYMPFIIYTFMYNFCKCAISGYIRSSVRIILFSNTTVNFFAYIFAHPEFRRGLFRHFCRTQYLDRKRAASAQTVKTISAIDAKVSFHVPINVQMT